MTGLPHSQTLILPGDRTASKRIQTLRRAACFTVGHFEVPARGRPVLDTPMSDSSSLHPSLERPLKMVEQSPENELARFSLGKAWFNLGEFAKAKEQFVVALAKKPDWMVVQILIGKCDLSRGDKASAKSAFERARHLAIEQNHEGPLAEMEQALEDLEA
jgi:tetratricopeptide (TPR) repeat protein